TTTPIAKFSVKGGGTTTGRLLQLTDSNNVEKVTILDSGNVGIGTTGPQSKLHVLVGNATPAASGIMNTGVIISAGSGSVGLNMGTVDNGYGNARYSWINSAFTDSSGVTSPLVLQPTDGNVGIGSTSPSYLLGMEDTAGAGGFYDATTNIFTQGPSFSWMKQDRQVLSKTETLDILNNTNIEQFRLIEEVDEYGIGADTHIGIVLDEAHDALATHRNGSITGYSPMRTASVAFRGVQLLNQVIDITDASTTAPSMFVLNNGNFGIATSVPTHILTIGQGMGNAIADGWEVYSSREYKTDITYLEEKDYQDILDEIEGMDIATYKWKTDVTVENTSTSTNLGVIAEEAPTRVLSEDGKSISLYDYATFAIAGVKALKSEVDELRATLEANGYLSDSATLPQTDIALSGLVIDEEGYAVIDKIKSKFIETENLKVRAENRLDSGITIYDSKTGDPYCLYIEYGVPMTRSGECSTVLDTSVGVATTTPDLPAEAPLGAEEGVIVDELVATTTPEVIKEPIVEEPIVEESSTSTPAVIVE
ncbi:tail fiber domain-containing protein, partial [Patescibacteria group bacterium]|nr:tail fiber domain-containing protein [Patescibacteria group bacterium]